MGMHPTISRLNASLRLLHRRWLDTRSKWGDRAAERYEQDYMHPLEAQAADTLKELQRLAEVLEKASRNVP